MLSIDQADKLVTKTDLKAEIAELKAEIAELKVDLIKWMAGLIIGAVIAMTGIFAGIVKLTVP